jgi:hypothetical protein
MQNVRAENMQVGIHANIYDRATENVANAVRQPFEDLSKLLQGPYGGVMEHLLIDLELVQSHSRSDGKQRFPFRFQKRVSGHSRLGLAAIPDIFNVGHFSVKPDLQLITSLSKDRVVPSVLSFIYESTSILLEKQKKLGGFDAVLFRNNFLSGCRSIGYDISSNRP